MREEGGVTSLTQTKTDNFVLFPSLPMPPSSNNQYVLARRGGKTFHVCSKELNAFKAEMEKYPLAYLPEFLRQKTYVRDWLKNGFALEVRAVFFFYKRRLFTKAGTPKKLDVSNRLKACHDQLAKILEIDDCTFFRVYAEKAICHDNLTEQACVEISPVTLL